MKYFYMICLTLSSFFTYKYLFAAEQATQYAFFIPNNSFQNNIYEEEENERQSVQPSKQISNQPTKEHKQGYQSQRIKVSQPVVHKTLDFKPTGKTTKPNDPSPHSPKDDFKDHLQDHSTPNNKSRDNLDNQQRHRPGNHHRPAENRRRPPDTVTIKQRPLIEDYGAFHSSSQLIDQPETIIISPDTLQYLDINDPENITILQNTEPTEKEQDEKTRLENFMQLETSEMLDYLPFPDFNLPKFKQLYASYGMELRILHKHGQLPFNQEQDNILEKANSIQRFKVE